MKFMEEEHIHPTKKKLMYVVNTEAKERSKNVHGIFCNRMGLFDYCPGKRGRKRLTHASSRHVKLGKNMGITIQTKFPVGKRNADN